MADTKAEGSARAPTLKQLKAREQQLATKKTRLREELDQVTAEHKDVKAKRVEAERAEKAAAPAKPAKGKPAKAKPAKAKAAGNGEEAPKAEGG